MGNIITLTLNPTIDMSAETAHVIPNHKTRCHSIQYEPGGGGINVARAISILGSTCTSVYLAGGDNGNMLNYKIKNIGNKNYPVRIKNPIRLNITVLDKTTKEQFRFIFPGPVVEKDEHNNIINLLKKLIKPGDFVVASGSLPQGIPEDIYARIARITERLNGKYIIDTRGYALRSALKQGVYLNKSNSREIQEIVGSDIMDESKQETILENLIRKKWSHITVVSLGAAGALVATQHAFYRFRSPNVAIKSRVGAGDSMLAGIVLNLAQGNPIETAVLYGIAAGASAVMTPRTELCRRKKTEQLFRNLKKEYIHVINRKS